MAPVINHLFLTIGLLFLSEPALAGGLLSLAMPSSPPEVSLPNAIEGAACPGRGATGFKNDGAMLTCQSGIWSKPQTFMKIDTIVSTVNYYCSMGDPGNPPNYTQDTYRLTCGSRFCYQAYGYGFGMVNENGLGWNIEHPYYSPGNTQITVACSR